MSLNSDSKEKLYGVSALLKFMSDDNSEHPKDIFDEFKLHGRVALVTGSNGGIGLEIALVLAELGAKVWGVDLLSSASKEFQLCSTYAKILHQTNNLNDESSQAERLVYRQLDVTDEAAVQEVFQEIISTDRRLDVCVAAAGILPPEKSCIEVKAGEFKQVLDVNCTGVFITAARAAAEMSALKIPGSIILVASLSGSITNKDHPWIAYNTSKSAVIQMARSMACELGPSAIRVNSLSPGHIRTPMTAKFLDQNPDLEAQWSSLNPLGRLGKPHELRGVIAWLASDASTFCTGSDIMVSGGHHAW